MSFVWLSFAAFLVVLGTIGCFVPVIPGPIVGYCGLLCMLLSEKQPSTFSLVVFGIAVIVVTILDFIVPSMGAKRFNCSKKGIVGCTIGTILGMFFFPFGILLGPFLGAFIGELIAGKNANDAALGGLGAFLGFLCGTFMKFLVCIAMIVYFIKVL